MKRILIIGLLPFLLFGCKSRDDAMNRLLSLREELLQSSSVSFITEITADYGEEFYTFSMLCSANESGDIIFTVLEPESIRDIRGTIDQQGGSITFDDQILSFDTMAEGRISPVSAPYVMMKALRGGYISSVSKANDAYLAIIDDTYDENALNVQMQFRNDLPVYAEIFWQQRRILTLKIEDFQVIQQTVNQSIE